MTKAESQRHLVVFDCNIYLDAAELLGAPFDWEEFDRQVARLATAPVPHPTDRACDSLRAIAACTSGRFAVDELLEVWTCDHINQVVRTKAQQSRIPDPATGYRGLGWTQVQAQALVDDLIVDLTRRSAGGDLGDPFPDGNPPLDHEDGKVFGACRYLAQQDLLARVYCVTRDRGFLDAQREGRLSDHSRVMSPTMFLKMIRAASMQRSLRGMRPRRDT